MIDHQQMTPKPTVWCRIGRHLWEGADEHRRCTDCLKIQLYKDGKWYTRKQYNMAWCSQCGNEMVGCPKTDCIPVGSGVCCVQYTCGRCGWHSTFDYGLAPVAIKVESP